MMMNLLGRNTAAQTSKAIAEAASRLTELRAQRAAVLVEDDLGAIKKVDSLVREQEQIVGILQEKLRAQDQRRRKERQDAREQQKTAALAALEKALRAEADAAVAVVEALVAAANAYVHYQQIRSRPRPWSNLFQKPGTGIGITSLIGAIRGAFYWGPEREHSFTEVPKRAPELIERLRTSVDGDIARLRDEPLPRLAEEEDVA
jgi:hypothetical protein